MGKLGNIRHPEDVNSALIAASGILGGYISARETGIRPIGTVPLLAGGLWAGRTWLAKGGPVTAAALGLLYVGAFGASHPLAKRIGSWPSVFAVTGAVALASYLVVDRRA
ncbi:hypothetical protein GA0111570_101204 [Raineyella antarctica]|uniref:Uncharacterized protein n=1 Tax=Raineyella antarctica TaxID=1577474 RepID=A0A1G6GD61_9ACTN|nr:hypothetical protein [Raineyella antarctica]SDB79931.1 hypothetical protein GA0111570_101204 [Raineyella antarctica]